MYAVTQEFKDNIYADSRSIKCKVTFEIIPLDIDTDLPTVTASPEFMVSLKAQVDDNLRQPTFKMITWEDDRTVLDGSWTFPGPSSSEWGELGFVSSALCDGNGDFVTTLPVGFPPMMLSGSNYQSVTLTYNQSHTSAGVSVSFDELAGEYAEDFTIYVYNASNVLIYQQDVTNNTNTLYVLEQTLTNFRKITVTIKKWSAGYRRARVVEVDPGVVLVYDDDKLIRATMTEELDTISANLVIPEFEFTVDNSTNEFDILNPTGIYQQLQQRQRILPEIGLDLTTRTEWVPLGTYYLSEWRSDAGSLTTTFRGRSKIDLLDLTNYSQSVAQVGYTLYDMAVDVLDAAGVIGYEIDTALQLISTNGLIAEVTCRQALQYVAIAGRANIYINRNNVLKITATRSTTEADYIDFDSMFQEPQISQGKKVESVSVVYYTDLNTVGGTSVVTDSTVSNGERIVVDGNTLINNSTTATNVANWIQSRRNERNTFTIDYRANPAIELMDFLKIENPYITNQYMYATKNELTYEGFLRGKSEGRGS